MLHVSNIISVLSLFYFTLFLYSSGRECSQLLPPTFGRLIGPCNSLFGSTCDIGCEEGYQLTTGSSNITQCIADGSGNLYWSNEDALCQGS